MSTHALIAREITDNNYETIYCHFDGYYDHVGKVLIEHYTEPDKINALFALGDLSALGPEIGEKHDSNNYGDKGKNWCKSYGRDRGEKETESKIVKSKKELKLVAKEMNVSHVYIYENRKWLYEIDGRRCKKS